MRKHSVNKPNKKKKEKKVKIPFKDRDVFYKIVIYRRIAFVFGLIGVLFLMGLVGNIDTVPVWSIYVTTIPMITTSLILFSLSKYLSYKYKMIKPPVVV